MSTTDSVPSRSVKPIRPISILDLFIVITVIGLTLGLSGYYERMDVDNSSPANLNWMWRWLARANAVCRLAVPASGLFCLLVRWRRDGWPGWKPGYGLLVYLGLLAVLEAIAIRTFIWFRGVHSDNDPFFAYCIYYSVLSAAAVALAPMAFRSMKGHRLYWKWLVVSLVAAVVAKDLAVAFQIWCFWLGIGGIAIVFMGISIAIIVSSLVFVLAWLSAVVMGLRRREGLGWLHWWGVAAAFCSTVMVWCVEYLTTLYYMYHLP